MSDSLGTSKGETDEPVDWVENLGRDEIEDLLGFDLSSEAGADRSGLRALINSALISHRRLPMLDVVFDRASRLMTTNLRQLTNDNVDVRLDDVSSTRFGDFLMSVPSPSVIGVVRAHELDNYCLIAIDAELVYSIVDFLLGGRSDGAGIAIADRGFTTIELALTQRVLKTLADDLTNAFEPVAKIPFTLERIETTPRFAAIAQNASVCSLAKFRVEVEGRGGRAAVLFPHATLEPIYKLLLREFISEMHAGEDEWSQHLHDEVNATKLDLRAVLAEKEISIADLGQLKAGETILFGGPANKSVEIRAGETVVATGAVGRTGDRIAVRLGAAALTLSEQSGEAA